jgi:stage IV sporulation protein FB
MWKLWRIGKVFGVPLMMHGTFVLLLAFYAISGFLAGGAAQAVLNLALGLTVFAVVVLHELGHIAAYKHYGLKAKDIILSPLGGIARGIGMTKDPKAEFVIAAAGPAVNVVLAGLALLAVKFTPWTALGATAPFSLALTQWFLNINVVLLVFNLIPALPMDGGRMLRAALTRKMGYLNATKMAAKVARWSTLAMAIYAIATGTLTLLLIAGMIFVLSWVEVAQAHVGAAHSNPAFQAFRGFSRGGFPGTGGPVSGGATIVDQYGNPVGGAAGGGWSSAEHVRPTADGRGWTVQSVRFLED